MRSQALNDFLLRKSGKTWDGVLESGASLQNIDKGAIEDFKKGAIKSNRLPSVANDTTEEILTNLRLIENNNLKRAAILLFGKDPKYYYPASFIKIGKFGRSDSDLLFQDVIESPAFQLADKTLEVLDKKYISSIISYQGLQRIEKSRYPIKAIREVLLNAIVHRTYSQSPIQISIYDNKMIFWNEGELPNGLTIDDLKKKHPSIPKNPTIADVCFKGGLIEAWGRGTLKIIEECKNKKLPEPKFEVIAGGLAVTIYYYFYNEEFLKEQGLTDKQIKTILYVKEHGAITNSTFQQIFIVSESTALRELNKLCKLQYLQKTGIKKNTAYIINTEGYEG